MTTEEKLIKLMDEFYKICNALVSITEHECCSYGFDDEIDAAELYCKQYEKDHNTIKEDDV